MRIRTYNQLRNKNHLDMVNRNGIENVHLVSNGRHRSRLFHLLQKARKTRKYSAITVVIASVFLVSTNNVSTRYSAKDATNDHLFVSVTQNKSLEEQFSRNSIASLPYTQLNASQSVQSEAKQEIPSLLTDVKAQSAISYFSNQSFIATANAMEKDPEMDGGITLYTVQEGDTAGSIATKHNITVNTLYWANNIDNIDEIMPGDTLFILPVAGLKHIVKENETVQEIANKYEVKEDQIIAFNELPANGALTSGDEIIIPGAKKDIPEPEQDDTIPSFFEPRQYAGSNGKNVENRHGKPNTFPYGYCTWYVAQQKYVPWRGNAGAWLYNAKAAGYATGSKARTGSIVVTTDNTYYGHVAIVTRVSGDTITVKEMNYKGWGVVNTREINIKDRKIKGYIY